LQTTRKRRDRLSLAGASNIRFLCLAGCHWQVEKRKTILLLKVFLAMPVAL